MVDVAARATFRDVFSVRQFRALWLAQILSVAGDRLALVALAVLIFSRTHSPFMTAATYAVTYLPWLIGGLLLSGLADRYRRRGLMIICDLIRCGLTAIMAMPGVPLAVLVPLLFAVTMLAPPFESARAAVLPGILPGDRYVVGTAVARLTNQIGFVAGFAGGGVTVALAGPRVALAADAATFALSALLIRFGVQASPAAAGHRQKPGPGAVRLIFSSRPLRILTLLAWLAAFYVVPEGLAVPYAHQLGGGAVMAGLLLAAMPTGMGIGVVVFGRLVAPARRTRAMGPMAVCCCLPLLACWLRPDLAGAIAIFAATGVLSAYQLAANAAFVLAVPDRFRGQAFGLVMTGFSLGQSATLVAAGALAQAMPVTSVIAISGAVGTVAAAALVVRWSHATAGGPAAAGPPMDARRGRPAPSAEGSQEVQI